VILKLEGRALTWWESHTKTLRLEGDPPVTKREDFKPLNKSQFYHIGYVEGSVGITLGKGKSRV
jgi:hypothetical protein